MSENAQIIVFFIILFVCLSAGVIKQPTEKDIKKYGYPVEQFKVR